MPPDQTYLAGNLLLNENAQFYKKHNPGFYSDNKLKTIFSELSIKKRGNYLLNLRKQRSGGIVGEFSICVFKTIQSPTCIDEPVPSWEEHKIGYLLLLDFDNYIVLFKRNVSASDSLLSAIDEIEYKTLSSIFVTDETVVEKVSLNNTSVLPDAMAKKIFEANNLKNSMSTYGLGKYVATSLRLNNSDLKTSVVFNTSRITNYDGRKPIAQLITWGSGVIEKIKNFTLRETFVDIFAEPILYESERNNITPISILASPSALLEQIESNEITEAFYRLRDTERQISLDRITSVLNQAYPINIEANEGNAQFSVEVKNLSDVVLALNQKSITIRSKKASNLMVRYANGQEESLLNILNRNNDYIVNFDQLDLVYFQRKLFKDRGLLGTINSFMNVFVGMPEIEVITSEKGTFTDQSQEFSDNSLFHFIDQTVTADANYSFLDDLGDEWADFISIKENKLTFIHAKEDSSNLSASAFQVIVGQALKNIGNFKTSVDRLSSAKRAKWNTNFRIENFETSITRLRKGDNLDDSLAKYESMMSDPNFQREIILVINFISKNELESNLDLLKDGIHFGSRNQVIQMLWIISGLVHACMENGITIKILCKP